LEPDAVTSDREVDILLSTYNGEGYLSDQLDSILNQTFKNLRIIIRDDGSTDATSQIIEKYALRYPQVIIHELCTNVGIVSSYGALLDKCKAPYIFFCDQDDIWEPEKVEKMHALMLGIEADSGTQQPVLIYSDMLCVDGNGKTVAASFWKLHGINPEHNSLPKLLLQNVVTGTACCFNRSLLEVSMPLPDGAFLHDWWFALNATAFGTIRPVHEKLVQYRLHGGNVVGANDVSAARLFSLISSVTGLRYKVDSTMLRAINQAKAFLGAHSSHLTPSQRLLVEGFAGLESLSATRKKIFLLENRIVFSSTVRNLALLLLWR